jgi:hypothetical protein
MPIIRRNPTIDTPPLHPGGGPSEYTEYKIASAADREAVRQDVLRVAGNGSFVSRCLLVISRQGSSKNFVTITGEDGLTFGIKDFISDSVRSLLLDMEKRAPGTLATVFGSHAGDVVDAEFLARHTIKATDRGLIGIGWLRGGIDQVLCDRRFHGVQLRRFVEEAVRPSLDTFRQAGFQLAFSAAAMVGVANSFGASGMVNRLVQARKNVGESAGEAKIIRRFVQDYALRDAEDHAPATDSLLRHGFGDEAGALPSPDALGHSGRRTRELFAIFPWKQQETFVTPGDFALDAEEQFTP